MILVKKVTYSVEQNDMRLEFRVDSWNVRYTLYLLEVSIDEYESGWVYSSKGIGVPTEVILESELRKFASIKFQEFS